MAALLNRYCQTKCALLAAILLVAVGARAEDHLAAAPSPLNAAYELSGETIVLENGFAEQSVAPGSASKMTTRIVGEPVFGDLDGDGDRDAVLWLMHQAGGTGTFYYIAAAFRHTDGFRGTRAVLIGDRIETQTLSITRQLVVAEYLDRKASEPMATEPTKRKEVRLKWTADGLVKIN